jgi:hypothetical protein
MNSVSRLIVFSVQKNQIFLCANGYWFQLFFNEAERRVLGGQDYNQDVISLSDATLSPKCKKLVTLVEDNVVFFFLFPKPCREIVFTIRIHYCCFRKIPVVALSITFFCRSYYLFLIISFTVSYLSHHPRLALAIFLIHFVGSIVSLFHCLVTHVTCCLLTSCELDLTSCEFVVLILLSECFNPCLILREPHFNFRHSSYSCHTFIFSFNHSSITSVSLARKFKLLRLHFETSGSISGNNCMAEL